MKLYWLLERFPRVWGIAVHALVGAQGAWGLVIRIGPFAMGFYLSRFRSFP